MEKHFTPEFKKESYHCPHCGVYSMQLWKDTNIWNNGAESIPDLKISLLQSLQ
jgi:hypothetical protein